MPNVRIDSNFFEPYDVWFDNEGELIFHRRSNTQDLSRQEAFEFMRDEMRLKVPRYGFPSDLFQQGVTDLVAYVDPYAHRGEGKSMMPVESALEHLPDTFCAEYLEPNDNTLFTLTGEPARSHSIRHLHVGNRSWVIGYWGFDDWRSNVGEGEVKVLCEGPWGYHPKVKLPLWAIDFVPHGKHVYAVDFNTAPGMRGTGLVEQVGAMAIANLIKAAVFDFAQGEVARLAR
jgi:hypothetical protein